MVWSTAVRRRGYLFPATSSTWSSVASASSAGSLVRRLSLRESTFRLARPPSSLGTLPRRLRSTFRLVSFFSLPSERGRVYEGAERERGKERREGDGKIRHTQCVHTHTLTSPTWFQDVSEGCSCVGVPWWGLWALEGWIVRTCNRFSVSTSSVRFSHSPMESLRWVRRFWSTFRIDSCLRLPEDRTPKGFSSLTTAHYYSPRSLI